MATCHLQPRPRESRLFGHRWSFRMPKAESAALYLHRCLFFVVCTVFVPLQSSVLYLLIIALGDDIYNFQWSWSRWRGQEGEFKSKWGTSACTQMFKNSVNQAIFINTLNNTNCEKVLPNKEATRLALTEIPSLAILSRLCWISRLALAKECSPSQRWVFICFATESWQADFCQNLPIIFTTWITPKWKTLMLIYQTFFFCHLLFTDEASLVHRSCIYTNSGIANSVCEGWIKQGWML